MRDFASPFKGFASPISRNERNAISTIADQTVEFGALTPANYGGAKLLDNHGNEVDVTGVSGVSGTTSGWTHSGGRLIRSTATPALSDGAVLACTTALGTVNVTIKASGTDGNGRPLADAYSAASTTEMQAIINLSSTPSTLAGKYMLVRSGTYDTITDLTFTDKFTDQTGIFTIAPHRSDLSVIFNGWNFLGNGVSGTNWVGGVTFKGIDFFRPISWWYDNDVGSDSNAHLVAIANAGTSYGKNISFDYCRFRSDMGRARSSNFYANYPFSIANGGTDTFSVTNCVFANIAGGAVLRGPDNTFNNNELYGLWNDGVRVLNGAASYLDTTDFQVKNNYIHDEQANGWIYHTDFLHMFGTGTGRNTGPGVIQGNIIIPGYYGNRDSVAGGSASLFDTGTAIAADRTVVLGDDGTHFSVVYQSGAIVVTLPSRASVSAGWKISVGRKNYGRHAVSVVRAGSDTINGSASPVLLPNIYDTVLIETGAAGNWIATPGESISGPCKKTADFTISATADNRVFLVDASAGPVTVTLPSSAAASGNEFAVQKIDQTSNAVTLDLNGSDTYTARVTGQTSTNPVLSTPWRGIHLVSTGTSNWTEAYIVPGIGAMIMQTLAGGVYTDIDISGNIWWATGNISNENTTANIQNVRMYNNSFIQPIPGDQDGDGIPNTYPDGFDVSLDPAIFGFGASDCAIFRNLANDVTSGGSALVYDNNTDLSNASLSSFTTLLNGDDTATDFFPLTRQEAIDMARPRSAANAFYGAVGTTDENGFYNFSTKAPNTLPAPTIVSYSPADNATLVPGNSPLIALFDQPVKSGTGNILLRSNNGGWGTVETFNIATGTGSAGGTVTLVGRTLTITPGANMVGSREHAIHIAGTCIDSRVYGTDFAGIANDTTWSFTTAAPAVDNLLTNPGAMTTAPWSNAGGDSITDSGATFSTTGEKWWQINNTARLRYDTNDSADPFTPAESTTYTYSVYMKRGSGTVTAGVSVRTLGSTDKTSSISVATWDGAPVETLNPDPAHSATLTFTNLGGNEYRLRFTITTPAGTNRLLIEHEVGGADILVSSAMLTAGSTLESYVP